MKKKMNNVLSATLFLIGLLMGFGVVGRMETDMCFPFIKGVALIYAAFMIMGMGLALGKWGNVDD